MPVVLSWQRSCHTKCISSKAARDPPAILACVAGVRKGRGNLPFHPFQMPAMQATAMALSPSSFLFTAETLKTEPHCYLKIVVKCSSSLREDSRVGAQRTREQEGYRRRRGKGGRW